MALKCGDQDSQGRTLSRGLFRLTASTSYTLLKQRIVECISDRGSCKPHSSSYRVLGNRNPLEQSIFLAFFEIAIRVELRYRFPPTALAAETRRRVHMGRNGDLPPLGVGSENHENRKSPGSSLRVGTMDGSFLKAF